MAKLGETLKERRVALGISIEEAENGTKIRARLLEALEEGAYDRLPNPGYVRGYISSYARYLELDSGPLLNMYKAETGHSRTAELNLPQAGEAVRPTGQQHEVPWAAGVIAAVVIGVLSLAIWIGVRAVRGPEPTPPVPTAVETTTPPARKKPKSTVKPSTTPTVSTEQTKPQVAETPQPFTLTVRVAADGASWLRITVDDKPAYEGTLAGGQEKQFEVASRATVRVGKPESVTVLRDGAPVELTNSGDVSTVTLVATQTAQ